MAEHATPYPLGRQAITCRYRCGDACAAPPPNPTDHERFQDLAARTITRRGVLRAGAVLTLGAGAVVATVRSGSDAARPVGLDFPPVTPNTVDALVVPDGYRQHVVIRWGDPVLPGAPEFAFDAQTAAAQAAQFGYNNDFCGLVQLSDDEWLMVSNHEFTSEPAMFCSYDRRNPTEVQVRVAMAAHGMSVVVIRKEHDGRVTVRPDRRYSRRVTTGTEFALTGPAAGSPWLRTAGDPTGRRVLGTLNNCSGGVTPWGTVLSGEENVEHYFANADRVADPMLRQRYARYSITGGASERRWERYEPRFDLAVEPREAHRFGWVVELDPLEPTAPPVKHTALGRFKHEGAAVHVASDGRVVVYLGDDQVFEYVYRFDSDGSVLPGSSRRAREHNKRLLESGTLSVARFGPDTLPGDVTPDVSGEGQWIPLARGAESFVPGMSAEEVYVFTRLAADAVGATRMDRPEDVQPDPRTGRVYVALTNNTERGTPARPAPDDVNPRPRNKHGHVVELSEHGGGRFAWRLLLVCGDPADPATHFGGVDPSQVSPISCPDNLTFDGHGHLWICTDGNALGFNDGLYGVALEGSARGRVALFATMPVGAEACGPVVKDRFVLVSVQHPGDVDGASADAPASHWPDGGDSQPRPAVVAIYQEGRERIGL